MKTRLLMLVVLAAAFTVQQATAQNYIVIEDFEDPDGITIPLNDMTDGEAVDPDDVFEVVPNPDPDDVNSSENVLQYTRAHDGNPWGGFWSEVFEPLDMDEMKYTHYQVWKPYISELRFKVEGSEETEDFELPSMEAQTVTEGWETITFQFPDAAGEYPVIAVMPDFEEHEGLEARDEDYSIMYLDNIILSDSPDDPLATSAAQDELPVHMALKQNYPNPFNPTTNITFELNNDQQVTLNVYNIHGQLITTLVDGHRSAGQHQVSFDGAELSSGMYLYRLQTADRSITRTMTLVK